MALEPLGPGWAPLIRRAMARLGPWVPGVLEREGVGEGQAQAGAGPDRAGLPGWVEPVAAYLDEVVAWNRRTDLTAARSAEELVDLTVADAVVIAGASLPGERWVDVGSGAGAPGLVLALMLPGLDMTLVEPRDRRVAFLRSMIGKLGASRVRVLRGRSDDLPEGQWDVALSRATLPPDEWLEEGARLARRAVWVLLSRGDVPTLEGSAPDLDIRYEWPLTAVPRRAVRFVPVTTSPRDA